MFTLHVGAEIHGRKDNLEVVFPQRPNLNELLHRVHAVFSTELRGAPFSVEQVRVYDEVLGRWVDLVNEDQLHAFAQLYAFQPDFGGQTDLRGLIPAPRRTNGSLQGVAGAGPSPQFAHGAPQPGLGGSTGEQLREQQRHQAIAQHLNSQLGGGGAPATYHPPPPHFPPQQPATPTAQIGSPYLDSPSQHSPIQQTGGPTFLQRDAAGQAPPGLPGINPAQAEIDAQREQERHRLIAQHLNQQLSAEQQPQGSWAQTPRQHQAALPPAPSPVQPSPAAFMPSPAVRGFQPQSPVMYNPPANSPVTPMVPGLDPRQAEIDEQREQERHRLIAQHLNQQLGSGAHPASPQYPASPVAPPPQMHQAASVAPPQGAPPPPPPQAVSVPGINPAQAEIDAQREQERHRLIAQHLGQQLQGGGAGSVAAASPAYAQPQASPQYATSPPQYATSPPQYAAGGGAPAYGAAAASPHAVGGGLGANPNAESAKEAERHRQIAAHLHNTVGRP